MKYTHIFLFFAILFVSVTTGPAYGAENLDDFHKQFLALSEKLYDEEEGDDAYDALVKLLTKDEAITIALLSQCSEEELSDIDEVFPDVAFTLKSPKLLECVRQLQEKYPETLEDFVLVAEDALEEQETLTPEAFEELRKKADQNDPDSLYKLAMCYYTGNGTSVSYVTTYKLAWQAKNAGFDFAEDLLELPVVNTIYNASKGDPVNMYFLGRIYEMGLYGFKQNPDKARKWYADAEKAMTPQAMFQIAEFWDDEAEESRKVEDAKKAIEWYIKAANAGVAEAQFEYGWYYENLDGSQKNLKLAHDWYLKAAEQGHAEAQYRLGIFYGTGEKGVPWNPTKAVEWYRKAAEQGHPIAQHNYGTYIQFPEYGGGLSGGYEEARKWYQKAADQGFEWAELKARIPYGAPGFFEEADRIMKKMAEQGNVAALRHCAWRAETTGETEETFKYYLLGEKTGSVSALNGLGNCYRYGWGTPKDEKKAIEYYLKAAEKGSIPALVNLSECYATGCGVEKNEAAAEEWKTKIKDIGPDAMNELAFSYLYGGKGVEQNDKKAVEWFTKAAELGHVWAQYELGDCYHRGKGVEQDYKKAVEWFRKAAKQGLAEAQNSVGWFYKNGLGVDPDDKQAVKWYTKAAEQGLAAAQSNLGICYLHGSGVKMDHTQAVAWFTKAAEQGLAKAQFNLGWCYEIGLGVDRDREKAIEWYTKAAEQGDKDAEERIEFLKD